MRVMPHVRMRMGHGDTEKENRRLRSALDSAKHVRCGGQAALSSASSVFKKRRSSLSSASITFSCPDSTQLTRGEGVWCTSLNPWASSGSRSVEPPIRSQNSVY